MKIQNSIPYYHRNIEEYRGRNDPEAIKAVAREMEALFAYQMIKAMRETTNIPSKNSLGYGTYISLFDMELARLFAGRGLGLQDVLLKGLNKAVKSHPPQAESAVNNQESGVRYQESNSPLPPNNSLITPLIEGGEGGLPVDGIVSSSFGMRKHPIYGDLRFHHGMDIAAPEGTDVYPIREGKVIFSGEQSGYGNVVIIDHGDGFISKYAHNKVNVVKEGDAVDANTVIAHVGSTGRSTGPHLHFEVRYKGESINPIKLITIG